MPDTCLEIFYYVLQTATKKQTRRVLLYNVKKTRYNGGERRKRGRSRRHRGGKYYLIIYKSVLLENEKEKNSSLSIIIIFALVPLPQPKIFPGCETYSLSLSLFKIVKDIPPKLQNRKNARDRVVRES